MRLTPKMWAAGAMILALAGCGTPSSIERVAMMDAGEDAFLAHLHAGYVDLASKEAGFYDWVDAAAFRDKAEAVASGILVLPWDPADRGIDSEETMALLAGERAALMAELDSGDRAELPEAAARAQAMFDCWVEEAEEGPEHPGPIAAHQEEQMALCRDAFFSAMEELLYVAPEPAAEEPQTEFIVYFAWDRSDLSALAKGFLDSVAAEAVRQQPSNILVAGHADTAGSAEFNVGLSERRAKAVADYLAAAGVDASNLDLKWYGESMPAVDTGDEVRNPGNRRVEITFE